MTNLSTNNLVWLKNGQKRYTVRKIGTGLNCEKGSILTVKIGVFRMYLGSIKDAENLTYVPETKFDLPSSNNTDKDTADEITETAFHNFNKL